jgi:hypothetical protein
MQNDYWKEMKSSRRCSIYSYKKKFYCFSLVGAENGQFESESYVILDKQTSAECLGQTLIDLFEYYKCERKFFKWDDVDRYVRNVVGEKSKRKFEKESVCLVVIQRKKRITIHYPVINSPNLSMNENGDIPIEADALGQRVLQIFRMYGANAN